MKTKLLLGAVAVAVTAAGMPALGSDISADVLWNRAQPSRTDTVVDTSSDPAYRAPSLIGHPHHEASPGITGPKTADPAACHCAMMDHARR